MNPSCSALLQNHLPPKEQDPGSFIIPCSIRKLDFNNALADLVASISMRIRYGKVCMMTEERILKDYWKERFKDEKGDLEENLEDREECGEDKANAIIRAIHDKLNDDWFNNISEDEDEMERILDYLNQDHMTDSSIRMKKPITREGSRYKEVEFEISLIRFHVVARFCLGVTTLVTL
ncbi:hypothetical protein Tco_0138035 [Tanacetum coccineum]